LDREYNYPPFCYAPIAGLEVVASVVGAEWRHIQNLIITVYLLGHANTRIQNLRFVTNWRRPVFEKCWIYIRVLGQSRRYQAPSSAVVRKVKHLCQLNFFPSSIAIFVEAIGPRIQLSAILFRPHRGIGGCSFCCRGRMAPYSKFENHSIPPRSF
jgi:hypothetical protein